MKHRRIVIVAFDGVQILDVAGPTDVFWAANQLTPPASPRYRMEIVGPRPGTVTAVNGLRFAVLGLPTLR